MKQKLWHGMLQKPIPTPKSVSTMGHHISAIIGKNEIEPLPVQTYGLAAAFEGDYIIILLDIYAMAALGEKLQKNIDSYSENLYWDCELTYYLADKLGLSSFALIQTDYFGGTGTQYASFFQDGKKLLTDVPINEALQALGVARKDGMDEFDSINLGSYRSTECYYWEDGNAADQQEHMIAGRILKD